MTFADFSGLKLRLFSLMLLFSHPGLGRRGPAGHVRVITALVSENKGLA